MPTLPMLAVISPVRGLLSVNGRLAGGISSGSPMIMPVNPDADVFLTLFPLDPSRIPVSCALRFRGGVFVPDGDSAARIPVILWQNGIVETELIPAGIPRENPSRNLGGGYILRGSELVFPSGGILPVPVWSGDPVLLRQEDSICLIGSASDGGMFLVAATPSAALLGMLRADSIEHEEGGGFHALVSAHDTVGHGRLEQWQLRPEGLMMVSQQPVWADGVPHRPETPEETVLAAMEAAMAGLDGELAGYLAANADIGAFQDIARSCDACALMKYPLADARPCIALLRSAGSGLLKASPLYYRVRRENSVQSKWRVEAFGVEP